MAISVLSTSTNVNLKYPAKTSKGLSAYTLGVGVKNDASADNYFAFAIALDPLVDADERELEAVVLSVTETIQ